MEMMLIRHGRPEEGEAADPGLSASGHEAAALLAEHLTGGAVRRPDAVWSSPMRRALETASPIAELLGLPVQTDDRLREFDHGAPAYVAADDATTTEARTRLWRALETGWWGSHRFDPEAFARDVEAVLDDIAVAHPRGTVAVVCHAGVINAHLCSVLDRPRGMFCHLEHTSFSRLLVSSQLDSSQRRRQVHSVNETAHLQVARLGAARGGD
jgi:2,3-bisphosphoglycerate-dependent phosphoglycerate mutase